MAEIHTAPTPTAAPPREKLEGELYSQNPWSKKSPAKPFYILTRVLVLYSPDQVCRHGMNLPLHDDTITITSTRDKRAG